jgi:anti-sigma factor RsiW
LTCHRARALISEYVDERLSPAMSQRLRDHLRACSGCRSEWQEIVALKHAFARAATPGPSPGFWDQIYDQLRAPCPEPRVCPDRRQPFLRRLTWRHAPAFVAAAAAAMTLILAPLAWSRDLWDTPAMDTQTALAHHAVYCAQLPLADRRSMDYIAAEARSEAGD